MNRPIISQLFFASTLFAISLANPFAIFGAINNASSVKCGVAEPQGHYGFFPWMAFFDATIADVGGWECSATIVGANWILTAAHCVIEPHFKAMFDSADVYVGARDHLDGQKIAVADKFPNPNFNLKTAKNDIALLKLETPLEFDGIKLAPICLGGEFEWGQKATIAGWGFQNFPIDDSAGKCEFAALNGPSEMLIGQETLVKPEECQNADGTDTFDDPVTKICTKPLNAEIAQGDSGGPLMVQDSAGRWRQIGIISYGHCHFPKRDRYDPDIFAAIAPHCDWIKETTDGEVQCGI